MTGLSDLQAGAIISGSFLLLLAVAEAWSRFGNPEPEWTRKLVHFGGGMLCLSFPWLIDSPVTVLVLGLSNASVIVAGRKAGFLRCLHSVSRKTAGGEYYPISVFLLFLITYGRPWLYVSALLVLAVADAFAALIGTRYGRLKYNVEDSDKSIEGSAAFLLVAFLAMYIPMVFMTDFSGLTCLLAALLVGVLVTGFEAVSLRGTDNIFVPIGVAVILSKITAQPVSEIVYQNISMLALLMLLSGIVYRTKSFNVGGSIVFSLFVYAAWSLGSELWAISVITGYLVYALCWLVWPLVLEAEAAVKVRIVFRAILPSLLLLICGNMFDAEVWTYVPFLVSVASVTAISVCRHIRLKDAGDTAFKPTALVLSAIITAVATALPSMIISPMKALWILGVMVLLNVSAVFAWAGLRWAGFNKNKDWISTEMILVTAASLAALALHGAGILPVWAFGV